MKRLTASLIAAAALVLVAAPAAQADFSITSFDGGAFDHLGEPANQAGSHPFEASTRVAFETVPNPVGTPPTLPSEALEDLRIDLPPGVLGNPTAASTCAYADFFGAPQGGQNGNCPPSSAIGRADVEIFETDDFYDVPVFNLEPSPGQAARFGFVVIGFPVTLEATLSAAPPYHAVVATENVYQSAPLYSSEATIWGVPADPAHDAERPGGAAAGIDPAPFLTLPTSCVGPGPNNSLETTLQATSWEGSEVSASFFTHDNEVTPGPLGIEGCDQLDFDPTLAARPTTNVADSPSGLDVDLTVPQNEAPCAPGPPAVDCGNATAHLKDTTVELPEGIAINPSGANGLGACLQAQANLDNGAPAACPEDSKVGVAEVSTPLLDHSVKGAVYVAAPHDNPFNSLLALYIALNDPRSGTVVKLAGEVRADPVTGQLASTFEDNPQVPFETFSLDFFEGPSAPLRTPPACGSYQTTSTLTPHSAPDSGPPAVSVDTYDITQSPGAGACPGTESDLPHSPGLDSGSTSPIAGQHSPFVVNLRREDGTQRFKEVTISPPPGLTAKLAGTEVCSDAALAVASNRDGVDEQASPSCPAASRIGSVFAAAGAGPAPYWAPGAAYLSGPYKSAPLSMAIVTPAVAGPFDLGVVVIRTALHVDPRTAEITAVSDPIPQMLQGIPLDIRTASVRLDRPDFALNGTSCEPTAVTGLLTSTLGASANLHNRFQLGECRRLGFKPKLTLRLKGGTKRGKHPQLTAVIVSRPGDANIRRASVSFPRSEFLENAHIRTICTRPDFAADNCPAGAVYGTSTVFTPLLDYPLTGDVYLRSSDNLLPDLVPDLRGPAHQPVRVEAAGRTDSIRGGIRNTFDFLPDAPFSRAVLKMQGGNKGLLVNSRDICARAYRAKVRFTAHNGMTHIAKPKLVAKGCKKAKRRGHKRGKRGAGRSAVALRSAAR